MEYALVRAQRLKVRKEPRTSGVIRRHRGGQEHRELMTARTALFATALTLGLAACGSQDPSPLGPETVTSAGHASANGVTDDALRQALQDLPFRRILCFGDSLTFGVTSRDSLEKFSLSPVEGYIPKLFRLLRKEFEGTAKLTNSGIGAETTGQGLERLRSEIRSERYDLVLLLEGVVDVNFPEPDFQQARANLKEMMRVVKGEGVPMIIGTIPPLNADGFRTQGIENIPKLNEMIRAEAAAERVPVADHEKAFGKDLSLQGPDGLHPNDSGYEMMAQTWFDVILKLAADTES